ncbi:MAG: SAV_915 family protein [Pseudonocardiaceae bacterium]
MDSGGAGVARRPGILDSDESWHLPAQVYVPARLDPASGGPVLDVRELTDGRHAMSVYSSMERLIACCGSSQPWITFSPDRLPALQRGGTFDVVVVDADVPVELRGCATGRADDQRVWHDPESADWASVFVPSQRFCPGDVEAKLELQPMPGDQLALMIYSSQDLLSWGCGPHQPWVSIPAGLLDEVRQQAGAHTIVLDTPLPVRLRHCEGESS